MTRDDLQHCGKVTGISEELNRSVRKGRIEPGHSKKILKEIGSRSHNLGAELRMHSLKMDCDNYSNREKVAVIAPVTSAKVMVTGSKAMFALSLFIVLLKVSNEKTGKISTRVNDW